MRAQFQTKARVSVSEMAQMVGLSRARFYQLIGSAFPWPLYDVASRRPFYDEGLQMVCLDVRRRNCGIDGKAIMFYGKRPAPKPRMAPQKSQEKHTELTDGLKALGLTATAAQVGDAVKQLYPTGVGGMDEGEVLRAVFLYLKRQDSSDSVG